MGELERLGESGAFGEMLLEVLQRQGWTIARRPAFGGAVIVFASNDETSLVAHAPSLVDAAHQIFAAAARHARRRAA